MIDNFLPIPDAESLPLYRMALKLACVYIISGVCKSWKQTIRKFINIPANGYFSEQINVHADSGMAIGRLPSDFSNTNARQILAAQVKELNEGFVRTFARGFKRFFFQKGTVQCGLS